MPDINKKRENYKKNFEELKIDNREELERFLCAYSYFITKTNKNYKYNLTYLQSYFEDFINVRKKVIEKKEIIGQIKILLENEIFNSLIKEIKIIVDRFWILTKENDKKGDVWMNYTEVIDKDKILSPKYTLEIQIKIGKGESINITRKVEEDMIEKEIKRSLNQLDTIIKKEK